MHTSIINFLTIERLILIKSIIPNKFIKIASSVFPVEISNIESKITLIDS